MLKSNAPANTQDEAYFLFSKFITKYHKDYDSLEFSARFAIFQVTLSLSLSHTHTHTLSLTLFGHSFVFMGVCVRVCACVCMYVCVCVCVCVQQNLARMEELNEANPLAKFQVNKFSDLTQAEFAKTHLMVRVCVCVCVCICVYFDMFNTHVCVRLRVYLSNSVQEVCVRLRAEQSLNRLTGEPPTH